MNCIAVDSKVVELAFDHERTFMRHRKAYSVGASLGTFLAQISMRALHRLLQAILRRQAKFFADQAVWFRGAAKEVDERPRSAALDPGFTLVETLRSMEESLNDLRKDALELKSRNAKTRDAHRAVLTAQASLFEAVRELRGAVQAYEADRCALTDQNRMSASDGALLANSLARLLDDK